MAPHRKRTREDDGDVWNAVEAYRRAHGGRHDWRHHGSGDPRKARAALHVHQELDGRFRANHPHLAATVRGGGLTEYHEAVGTNVDGMTGGSWITDRWDKLKSGVADAGRSVANSGLLCQHGQAAVLKMTGNGVASSCAACNRRGCSDPAGISLKGGAWYNNFHEFKPVHMEVDNRFRANHPHLAATVRDPSAISLKGGPWSDPSDPYLKGGAWYNNFSDFKAGVGKVVSTGRQVADGVKKGVAFADQAGQAVGVGKVGTRVADAAKAKASAAASGAVAAAKRTIGHGIGSSCCCGPCLRQAHHVMRGGAWWNNWNDFKSGVSDVGNKIESGLNDAKNKIAEAVDVVGEKLHVGKLGSLAVNSINDYSRNVREHGLADATRDAVSHIHDEVVNHFNVLDEGIKNELANPDSPVGKAWHAIKQVGEVAEAQFMDPNSILRSKVLPAIAYAAPFMAAIPIVGPALAAVAAGIGAASKIAGQVQEVYTKGKAIYETGKNIYEKGKQAYGAYKNVATKLGIIKESGAPDPESDPPPDPDSEQQPGESDQQYGNEAAQTPETDLPGGQPPPEGGPEPAAPETPAARPAETPIAPPPAAGDPILDQENAAEAAAEASPPGDQGDPPGPDGGPDGAAPDQGDELPSGAPPGGQDDGYVQIDAPTDGGYDAEAADWAEALRQHSQALPNVAGHYTRRLIV